jgi:NTE family protein
MKKGNMKTHQTEKEIKRPKVGVVLGSGGIKAMASIGLFAFIEEADIDVDLLIGCSGGSILAGVWAAGYTAQEIRDMTDTLWTKKLFSKIDYRSLLSIAGLPFGRFNINDGLIKPDEIHKTYHRLYGDKRLEDLPQRLMIQTTDVLSGEPILLSSGLLREAVYASGSLYPLMPPISINGRLLMDGVFSSPLPVMEAIQENMDVIIAMSFEEITEQKSKGFVQTLMRNIDYSHKWLLRNQNALSVDMHHYEIIFINVVFDKIIGLRSIHRIPEILKAGDDAVHEKKEEILAVIEDFK